MRGVSSGPTNTPVADELIAVLAAGHVTTS